MNTRESKSNCATSSKSSAETTLKSVSLADPILRSQMPSLGCHHSGCKISISTPSKKFGLHVLQQFYSGQQYLQSTLQALADTVARRSQGVFLWARFATFELINGLTRGEKLGSAALMQRLDEMPQELQDIYSRIFLRSSQDGRKTAGLILLLICYKRGVITSEMLQIAISCLPPSSPLYPDPATLSATEGSEDEFPKRLLAVTGGIVEVFMAGVEFGFLRIIPSKVPRLIHRTAQTYLERGGWREILGDIYNPALGSKTWTEICTQTVVERQSRLAEPLSIATDGTNWTLTITDDNSNVSGGFREADHISHQSSLDNPDGSPGSIPTSRRSVDVDPQPSSADQPRVNKPTPQTLFLGHAGGYIFEHASEYEETSATSSAPLLEALANSVFINLHLRMCHEACSWRVDELSRVHNFRLELVHLVAAHGLHRYVKDHVEELQKRQPAKYPNSIVNRLLEMVHLKKTQDSAMALKWLKRVAVSSMVRYLGPPQDLFETTAFLLEQCPIVEDIEILAAVASRSIASLEVLLKYRRGDISLLKVATEDFPIYLGGFATLLQGEDFGPLVALGDRVGRDDDVLLEDTQEVLAMLMHRGVQVNASCGSLGGVLHYIIKSLLERSVFTPISVHPIDLLLEKGADINQLGSQGTPLELLWKLANTWEVESTIGVGRSRELLRALIDRGAVNRRRDPNGLVPSVIQMRLFGCNRTDFQECKRFYREGPRDGGSVWPGPVPLHPDDSSPNSHSDFDIPFDEAIEEYRAAMGLGMVDNGGADGHYRVDE
ncbi:uncharacterized protein PV07_04523 [Cladophialophora immunda]|uniref:Uncharacterized protein n=1 Tax=Cladophialophora immunda TaxID=569365 RepID=A0A0D2CT06_9EURO|nr:uncharacterized protein PV07_04523 [Cladophialophora immunda]KIW33020.1 hypothetical protein PV07_04523 [Cladophialophora immunda]